MAEVILSYRSGTVTAITDAGRKPLLQELSFELESGESMALIGETGSGKTMTALSLMGLLLDNVERTGGETVFLGAELKSQRDFAAHLGREIVYIPQNGLEFLNPARTVRRQLYDSLERVGVSGRKREAAAGEKLALAGFEDPERVLNAYPHELSGGMAQRVTIAISACAEARLILADEPTNGLDEQAREGFMALLDRLFPEAARLIITHDMTVAALCDRCLVLCGGRSMELGRSTEVLAEPRSPYTRALLGALAVNGLQETPVLRTGRGVCPFYARCGEAEESCLQTMTRHSCGNREWWCKDAAAGK